MENWEFNFHGKERNSVILMTEAEMDKKIP
jgi:hypothetical protein